MLRRKGFTMKSIEGAVTVCLAIFLCGSPGLSADDQPARFLTGNAARVTNQTRTFREAKMSLLARHPEAAKKLRGVLLDLADVDVRLGRAAALEFARGRDMKFSGDSVTVIASPAAGVAPDALAEELARRGVEVVRVGEASAKIKAPIGLLRSLATEVGQLGSLRVPGKLKLDNTVISEGIGNDSWMNARNWHDHGFKGDGVKVAVIDGGFIGLASRKANDEIPSTAVGIDYTGTGMESDTSHGCGVAEVIYDMAPNAQLYLIKIGDELDLEAAENYCKTNGIRVVNHSMGWYSFNFFDGMSYSSMQPSPVGVTNDADSNGILWVNSAGNDRYRHALIQWRDLDGDNYLDWSSSGTNINQIGNLSAGAYVTILLTWDKWPTTDQDFDLYLVRKSGSTWGIVATSVTLQNGSQPPVEGLGYTVPSNKTGYYGLVVVKYSASTSPWFIVRSFYENLQYYSYDNSSTPAPGSIGCPADAASVFAIGAIDEDYYRTGPIESYSSIGPNNRAYTGGSALVKPDICGPDATASITYPSGFGGTSASSPHMAGAAALVLSRFPSYTNAQVRDYLETGGDNPDLGVAGKDNQYGSGPCVLKKVWYVSGYARTSGGAGIYGVLFSATNGGGSYTTGGDGFYRLLENNGWSGTVTPSKSCFAFDPTSWNYLGVTSDQMLNYTGTALAPIITQQPQNQTKNLGESAAFDVAVSGTPEFTYQWRKNGSNINGATSSNYTIGSVTTCDVASYDCVVTDSCDTVTSNVATLTITGTNAATVAQAKSLSNGTAVGLSGPVATRAFSGFFYVEDADRSSGIRVDVCSDSIVPSEGSVPSILGTLQTIGGERVITDAIVAAGGLGTIPGAWGMTNKSANVPLAVGLFVTLWGTAQVPEGATDEFTIRDGSKLGVRVKLYGVALPANGSFVKVRGALGRDSIGPVIRVNSSSDLW